MSPTANVLRLQVQDSTLFRVRIVSSIDYRSCRMYGTRTNTLLAEGRTSSDRKRVADSELFAVAHGRPFDRKCDRNERQKIRT